MNDVANAFSADVAVGKNRIKVHQNIVIADLGLHFTDSLGRRGRKRYVIESSQTALQPFDVILQQSDVAIDEAGWVVQLVRNSGGELAERGHLFRVNNLGLKTLKFSPPSRQFGILVLQRFFVATSVAQKCAPF